MFLQIYVTITGEHMSQPYDVTTFQTLTSSSYITCLLIILKQVRKVAKGKNKFSNKTGSNDQLDLYKSESKQDSNMMPFIAYTYINNNSVKQLQNFPLKICLVFPIRT